METEEIPTGAPSDWQPITNKHVLAILGKLGEETNELGTAVCRCIIQGLDEREPTTGKVNREWLADEIADVLALTTITIERLGLNIDDIISRRQRKIAYKEPWFISLAESP